MTTQEAVMNDAGVTLTHEFHLLPRREGNDHVNFRIGKRGFGWELYT